ncbi:MAG: hypothetical protein B7733_23360 [Myxococcales bacterium FL481]|nr:MAG: hypothetical protein B7733_23360 [Myxococcales bacterium FL481]
MILRRLLDAVLFLAATVGLVVVGSGCGPCYESLEVTAVTTPASAVVLSPGFELAAGTSVTVEVEPVSRSDRPAYNDHTWVGLVSQDPEIFRVEADAADPRRFALVGVAPGETCVDVQINGFVEDCIPATVTPSAPTAESGPR